MDTYWTGLGILILALAVNAVTQILVARFLFRAQILVTVFVGFGGGALALLLTHVILSPIWIVGITNIFIYCTLSYIYFHFVNISIIAVRVRILHELFLTKAGLRESDILARYDAEKIIRARIGRLTLNGQLIERESRFYLGKRRILYVAKGFDLLRIIIFGRNQKTQSTLTQG